MSENKKGIRWGGPPNEKKAHFRTSHPIMVRRSMEKFHADIGRLLEGKNFKNINEANAFLQDMISSGKPLDMPPRTALEEAQDLMYKAWDEPARKKRVKMARRALEISKDCADAYVLLAEETADNPEEEKALYEEGVKAGDRALGPNAFEEHKGHFWGVIETRPYMRARSGLAGSLWVLGERAQAIEHYKDMLRLNPGDNQGLRYPLINWLIEENLDREAKELLDRYDGDVSSWWAYSKALLKFRREGSNPKTDKRLIKAIEFNPFVPLYLLGVRKLPKHHPGSVGIGDEDEAICYVAEAVAAWLKTIGALPWLEDMAFEILDSIGQDESK